MLLSQYLNQKEVKIWAAMAALMVEEINLNPNQRLNQSQN
jgi:hypothetical protein